MRKRYVRRVRADVVRGEERQTEREESHTESERGMGRPRDNKGRANGKTK